VQQQEGQQRQLSAAAEHLPLLVRPDLNRTQNSKSRQPNTPTAATVQRPVARIKPTPFAFGRQPPRLVAYGSSRRLAAPAPNVVVDDDGRSVRLAARRV